MGDAVEGPSLDLEEKGRVRGLVAALRSGQFVQGHGCLNGDEKMCCLGVACEVAMSDNPEELTKFRTEDDARYTYSWLSGSSSAVLPAQVARWFGFSDVNPSLRVPEALALQYEMRVDSNIGLSLWETWKWSKSYPATRLNDEFTFTFAEIADCFELTFLPEDWEVTLASR